MDHTQKLGETNVGKLLFQFSLPAIIAMLIGALYNVIDRVYIGHSTAGALGIGGITIALPVMLVMWAFATMIGVGGSSLVSIRLGEGKKDEAEQVMGNSLMLLIVVSLLITLFGLVFLTPILKAYGASNDTLPFAGDYMMVFLSGSLFMLVGFGMSNFMRAEGQPKKAMIGMVVGPILNIILAPIFLFGFGFGIKGVAFATVLSQTIASVIVMSYYFSGKSHLKIRRVHLKLNGPIVGKVLTFGVPPFLMQVVSSIATVVANNKLSQYGGDTSISGMGIVASIQVLITMPIMGMSQGMQPIVGYNFGAKQIDRVKNALTKSLISAVVITTLAFIVTQLFAKQIVGFFNGDPNLIAFGSQALRVYLVLLPIIGLQIIGSGYFQAIGKPKNAMLIGLARNLLVFIPALLILPHFFQVDGVLYSGPVADFVAFLITGIILLAELRRLKQTTDQIAPLETMQPADMK